MSFVTLCYWSNLFMTRWRMTHVTQNIVKTSHNHFRFFFSDKTQFQVFQICSINQTYVFKHKTSFCFSFLIWNVNQNLNNWCLSSNTMAELHAMLLSTAYSEEAIGTLTLHLSTLLSWYICPRLMETQSENDVQSRTRFYSLQWCTSRERARFHIED